MLLKVLKPIIFFKAIKIIFLRQFNISEIKEIVGEREREIERTLFKVTCKVQCADVNNISKFIFNS